MARRITNAGAFYAFISRGLGRPTGVGAALVAVVAYNLLQVGLYGMFGPTLADYADTKWGISAPWWAWALGAWFIVTLLGLLRVDLNGIVLGFLLTAEIIVVLVLAIAGLGKPANGYPVKTLLPWDLIGATGVGALLVTALLGFVGFEASAVFSEESKNPRRTVPAATYTALIVICGVYALASWAMVVHFGGGEVAKVAGDQGPGMLFGMSNSTMAEIATVLFMTSLFAAMLSFHNAVGRYMFALGREHVLPGVLGRTNLRNGAPQAASVAQSVVGLLVIVGYAIAGWDPTVRLFFWLGTTGGFGVLALITVTAIAVLVYFARDPQGENLWRRVISPSLALIGLLYMMWAGIDNYATLLGVPPGSTQAWALPGAYAVVAVIGILYGLLLRATNPRVYEGIGMGANAPARREQTSMFGQREPYSDVRTRTR
jgi:amino acid transporter